MCITPLKIKNIKNNFLKINSNQFLNGYAYNPGNDGRAVKDVREREYI